MPKQTAATIEREDLDDLMTTPEAARFTKLAVRTLENDRVSGALGLPHVRLGGRAIRYSRRQLNAYIEANTHGTTGK